MLAKERARHLAGGRFAAQPGLAYPQLLGGLGGGVEHLAVAGVRSAGKTGVWVVGMVGGVSMWTVSSRRGVTP
jgi:hypothetical protein